MRIMLGTLDAVSVSGYRAACALLRILRRGDIVPVGLRSSTGIDGQPTVNTGNGKRKSVAEFLKALRVDLKALRADDQVTDPEIASALGGRGKGDSTWI
jgi:hypothetical protein